MQQWCTPAHCCAEAVVHRMGAGLEPCVELQRSLPCKLAPVHAQHNTSQEGQNCHTATMVQMTGMPALLNRLL